MRVLLHACCGPCASACVPRLREEGHEVTLFYSNANIATREEFEKRLAGVRRLGEADEVAVVVDDYDHAAWRATVAAGRENAPERGERCTACFRYSLARTAAYAAAHGFDAFTSSLTVSPHKVSAQVFRAGEEAAWTARVASCGGSAAPGPRFLPVDFKKKDGFLRSLARTRELGLYRQSSCGCEFGGRAAAEGRA